MLYLSRKLGESVIINGSIEVVVEAVQGKNVRLGIKSTDQIEILRKEVYDRIQQENQQALQSSETLIKTLGGKK